MICAVNKSVLSPSTPFDTKVLRALNRSKSSYRNTAYTHTHIYTYTLYTWHLYLHKDVYTPFLPITYSTSTAFLFQSNEQVLRALDQSKSTYCTTFARLCKEVFTARLEANDNMKYLRTLEDWFRRLNEEVRWIDNNKYYAFFQLKII